MEIIVNLNHKEDYTQIFSDYHHRYHLYSTLIISKKQFLALLQHS